MNPQVLTAKILIVDDVPDNIHTLSALLDGFKKIVALNGQKALELAQREPHPDLILLDVQMPEMDGYEVCRRLKSSEETKNIPVMFVSANSESDEMAKGLEVGAEGFISKPIAPDELIQKVNKLIK